jgi:hypothetical protein
MDWHKKERTHFLVYVQKWCRMYQLLILLYTQDLLKNDSYAKWV